MRRRRFTPDGPEVSEVGLGTWQIGGTEWGDVSEDAALDVLRSAVEHGMTFFDTADIYGGGRSERLIGRFLAGSKAEVFVATKLGRRPDPGWPENFTLETMRRHTEDSLERLRTDALDLTQLHCVPKDALAGGEIFEHLRALRKEGKIRRFGASVESMEEALICLEEDGLSSLQIIFNIFRQKPIDTLFEKAEEKGVALIVRLPLASGLLAGKFDRETSFPENDHRSFNRDGQQFNVGETFAGLPFETGVELAREIADRLPRGPSMAELALRWCLDHDAVTVVIPGAKRPEQVAQNARASELEPLGEEVHEELRRLYEERVREHIRGAY